MILPKPVPHWQVLNAVNDGMDAVIVCPTGVIGPYDFLRSEMGQLILDCVDQKPMLYVDGAYDFVDVRDVAQGLILAGEKGRCGESYILSGERIEVPDIIKIVQEVLGKRLFSLKFLSPSLASPPNSLHYIIASPMAGRDSPPIL